MKNKAPLSRKKLHPLKWIKMAARKQGDTQNLELHGRKGPNYMYSKGVESTMLKRLELGRENNVYQESSKIRKTAPLVRGRKRH